MKINLTIKKMLIGLVLIGVFIVTALSFVSFYSNETLNKSQTRLTKIVLPLETASKNIRVSISAFTVRQFQIIASDSSQELNKLSNRQELEEKFENNLARLEGLAQTKTGAAEKIQQLKDIYTNDFLKKDSAIEESVKKSLALKERIDKLISDMDTGGAELQKNAEAISGRINFAAMREKIALREYMKTEEKSDDLQAAVNELLQGDLTKTQQACNDLRLGVAAFSTYARQLLLVKNQENINSIKENEIAKAVELVETSLESLKKGVTDSQELISLSQKIQNDFLLLNSILSEVSKLREEWLNLVNKMIEIRASLKQSTSNITTNLDTLQNFAQVIRQEAETSADQVRKRASRFVFFAGLFSIIAMILTGGFIFRQIIDPINKAVSFADTISKGDLTAKIKLERSDIMSRFFTGRNDEVGILVLKLSHMAKNLNSLIGQVQQSVIQANSSSTQLATTARQQQSIMENQVESTNYVIRSVSEISNVSAELVTTMQQVASISGETAKFASTGQTDLARMEEAIKLMEGASKSISGKLETINEKAANITSVVTTITKVADQTNLLSLNAAIEAEKAGEYGRGFAVVAREIRRLADQTAVATLDIEQMVKEMQTAVSAGVMEMEAFIKEVQRSAEDVGSISTQLTRIIEQVQTLSPSFESVNESMKFQSEKAHKINNAMVNLGSEMQQTAESLKESFDAIEQLNEVARGLQSEVSRFTVAKET
ncbi:Methyl-accepting chemotaxis protein signailing-domain-containing protein [Desulfonema limicola]|uniref:Methyl-accepting chemotaxis protein signailing-domain-containing protein n=1 Tax=Desulfonema limicola TaxID=45656 RepID=A0A975GJT5_9BACT|nr:methyl-accepting chemotaxis protein [Desulfonema limicola]QTA83951.1 Methyl-accepting chemotaxis protein signailing-domain-containing protein [Desulfonema limicola]